LTILAALLCTSAGSFAAHPQRSTLAPKSQFEKQNPKEAQTAQKSADSIPVPERSYAYDTMKAAQWVFWATGKQAERVRRKIVRNIRHVTFREFRTSLAKTVKRLNEILKDGGEYAVIFDGEPHSSKRWVYELAKGGLARPPVTATYYRPFGTEPPEMLEVLRRSSGGKIPGRIVIFDDAAYSGKQLYYLLAKLNEQYLAVGEDPPEVVLAVPYITAVARQMFLSKGLREGDVLSVETIKTLDEILTENEQKIIQKDVKKRQGREFDVYATVTYFDHRVADRFSFNEIIDETLGLKEMVTPPYWLEGTVYYEAERREFDEFVRMFVPPGSLKVPGTSGLDEDAQVDRAYVENLLKTSTPVLIPAADMKRTTDIMQKKAGRAPPAGAFELRTIAHPDAASLFGMPKFKGASSITDHIPVLGRNENGKLVIYVTRHFYDGHVAADPDLFAEIIDHEYAENMENLSHRTAAGRARLFAAEGTVSPYHQFVIAEMAKTDAGSALLGSLVKEFERGMRAFPGEQQEAYERKFAARAAAAAEVFSTRMRRDKEDAAGRFFLSAENRDYLRALRPYAYLTRKYGYLPWKTMYDSLGDDPAYRLFTECLPVLESGLGRTWVRDHWDDIVSLVLAAGTNAERLVKETIPSLKDTFMTAREMAEFWPDIVELGRAAGKDVCKLIEDGIGQAAETFGKELRTYWSGLVDLARTAGEHAVELFDETVPMLKRVFGERLADLWPDAVALGLHAGKENVLPLLNEALPNLFDAFGGDFWAYRASIVKLGRDAGHGSRYLFDALRALRPLIASEDALNTVGADAKKALAQCRGAEYQTARALTKLAALIREFPEAWSSFIKPVIYNQTVGAHLCLDATAQIYGAGGIASPADYAFILELVRREKIRAYDLLENFIFPGLQDGSIAKPLSAAAGSIRNFLDLVPYRIVEVYRAFMENPETARSLTDRCGLLHRQIAAGDASAFDRDPLFSAILMHAFPPEVTTKREQYAALYAEREDRAADTRAVPPVLQNKLFEVSTGEYNLKDAARPLNERPWQTVMGVVLAVNREPAPPMGDEEIVILGGELLKNWENGALGRARRALITDLYRYARCVHGQTLPESMTTVQNVMRLKNFMGTTLVVLVGECVDKFAQAHPAKYQAVVGKMIKTAIENPKAKAEAVSGLLSRYGDEPAKLREGLGRVLRVKDESVLSVIVEKLKGLQGKHEVAAFLAGIRLTPRSGKESVMIAHALQGDDYKAMQGEVNAKYAFNGGRERLRLRFTPSKRKAHGVAGFNMGVCTATDNKLWDNPDYFNVIIFDEGDIACGGMHVMAVRDGGKRYLTLPGINPGTGLLTRVSAEEIYAQCVSYAGELAAELGCDGLLIPCQPEIHSNRSEIQRVVAAQDYDTLIFDATHAFAGKYAIRDCFVVPPPAKVYRPQMDEETGAARHCGSSA
jgi:hypothetical protein